MRYFVTILVLVFSFSSLAIAQPPAGYYNNANGLTCAALKSSLKNIISNNFNQRSYNDLWAQYQVSDVKQREVGSGSSLVIWDIYSDIPGPGNDPYNFTPGTGSTGQQDQGQGGNVEGEWYNREHTVPLSWFGGSTSGPGADYMHIFPVDKAVNGKRANWPYGEVASASFTSLNGSKLGSSAVAGITGTVFEPIDSFKGDVARAFFYFVTRYQDNMSNYGANADATQAFEPNTYPSVDIPFLRMMINWHTLDPVSQKEISRNNAAYSFQNNRNPFIDHPEYVDFVWNATCPGLSTLPVDLVYFKGKWINGSVMLEWSVQNEINVDRYEVERSYNGVSFELVGNVKATRSGRYSFADEAASNRGRQAYYRLRKVDIDGKYTYSSVVILTIPLNTRFEIIPNPATSYIRLHINNILSGKVDISLTDLTGKVIIRKTQEISGSVVSISTEGIAGGTYLVKLTYMGETYTRKVIVTK